MDTTKMQRMANQIATFFQSQPGSDQAEAVAAHINDFWSPEMRAALLSQMAQDKGGFDPLVQAAVPHIRAQDAGAP